MEYCGKKVMVAIGESESSYHALMWVLQNLREPISSSGNPLVIFMVQPFPTNLNLISPSLGHARLCCHTSPTPSYLNSVQEQNRVVTMGILQKAKSICTNHGIKAETIADVGDPESAICKAVQNYNVDLLVLGEDEPGKIKRLVTILLTSRNKTMYLVLGICGNYDIIILRDCS